MLASECSAELTCEEWDQRRGDVQRQGFCAPEQADQRQQGKAVLLGRLGVKAHDCSKTSRQSGALPGIRAH